MRAASPSLLLVMTIASGCATLVSGTTDVVRIDSIPSDANVTLDGETYRTPVTLTLSRLRPHYVTLQKDGYLAARRVISRVGNRATEGNLVVGGVLGILADQSSGAAFQLHPTELHVDLVPTTTSERVYRK